MIVICNNKKKGERKGKKKILSELGPLPSFFFFFFLSLFIIVDTCYEIHCGYWLFSFFVFHLLQKIGIWEIA